MDNGEVIPGLEQGFQFLGANLVEWSSGFVAGMIIMELFPSPGAAMPFVMATCIGLPYFLRSLRIMYPDEERGLRNHVMVKMGFTPTGIPAPAELQSIWSGCPIRELAENTEFIQLGLMEVINAPEPKDDEDNNFNMFQ